jgi:hypothetical protein
MPVEEQSPYTERERVQGWRAKLLVEAGMSCEDAFKLSHWENWRDALDLMSRGCTAELAFRITR